MPWPKVKTGPNRGQDRARNKKTGQIRGKRADAGKPRDKKRK